LLDSERGYGELMRDTLFTSPSAAPCFLTGTSTSGKATWKNDAGRTLRELEIAELNAAPTSPAIHDDE